MKLVNDLRLLWWRRLLETLRQPAWVFVALSTPLLYLALFAPLLQSFAGGPGFRSGRVLDVFVPGILALLAFSSGQGSGWIVIGELDSGLIERLRVTPTSRFALMLATSLRDVVAMAVPALIVVLVAIPFGFHPHWAGIAVLLVLLSLLTASTSAVSNALGLVLREIGSLASIVVSLTLPLTLLSGVLLPLSLAPGWMRALAHFNPLYYAVEASRSLSAGSIATWTVGEAFLVMAGVLVASCWWATRSYRVAVS
ncbi:MAG: ABC transporter permease [Candidatus Dormibacteraeota bacterium]|nr:ABC transporter permease [Candidatus Dormibacteraeota bacterium]